MALAQRALWKSPATWQAAEPPRAQSSKRVQVAPAKAALPGRASSLGCARGEVVAWCARLGRASSGPRPRSQRGQRSALEIQCEAGRDTRTEDASAEPASGPSSVQDRIALLEKYTSWSSDEEVEDSAVFAAAAPAAARDPFVPSVDADGNPLTVGEKLRQQYRVVVKEEVVVELGPPRKLVRKTEKPVTVSQRRNQRRAEYLDEVSQRNDSSFFAVVASSVLLPPVVILGAAYAAGYLEFLS